MNSNLALPSLPARFVAGLSQRLEWARPWLCVVLTGLMVAALRLAVGERFTTQVPFADDWTTVAWLERWSQGEHHWQFVFERHGAHFYAFARASSLLCFLLNGAYDMRLEFVIGALVAGGYAAIVQALFARGIPARQNLLLSLAVVFLIGIPFAGHRVSWGFLSGFAATMSFSLLALSLVVFRRDRWWHAFAALVLALMATWSLGSGCLVCLAIVAVAGLRSFFRRRCSGPDALLIAASLALFLYAFISMPRGEAAAPRPGVIQFFTTVLKAAAWPNVFLPASALVTLLPVGLFVWRYIRLSRWRTSANEFTLAVAALVLLQTVGMGLFRADEGNFNMPSNRYTDILVLLPLLSAICLRRLWQETPVGFPVRVFTLGTITLLAFGFSLHLLYRTWPFVARENGEWPEPPKVGDLRRWISEEPSVLPAGTDETRDIAPAEVLRPWLRTAGTNPVLASADVIGWPLSPVNAGAANFLPGAAHPAYFGRPAANYWGSYHPEMREAFTARFISNAFVPQRDYIVVEFLLDKRARFSAYRIPEAKLELVDEAAGTREDLLPKLRTTFPSLLRDRDAIYARVHPGTSYHLEATDASETAWFAFSEPRASGRCTPFTEGLAQSGKWILLFSISFVTVLASAPLLRLQPSVLPAAD